MVNPFCIQIQHLLKLNISPKSYSIYQCSNSNTTLVKVKLSKNLFLQLPIPDSNTTLVKVKCNCHSASYPNASKFKYNTC